MKYASTLLTCCALAIATTSCGGPAKNDSGSASAASSQASASPADQQKTDNVPAARSDDGFVKSPDGLECKVVTKGTGTVTPKVGQYVEMHVKFKIGDTVMINTIEMNQGKPVPQPIQAPTIKGDLMGGLMTMKAGDSAVFRMLMDTLAVRSNQQKPSWAKPGDYAEWEIKMVSIKTKEQMDAEAVARDNVQKGIDDKILQQYFKTKKIKNVQKAPSGFYYVVHKPGVGLSPKTGQTVTVNYSGQTLTGSKFDSNVDPSFGHVEPFSFQLNKHNVIKGWDEGVAMMKKGMKVTFYLPSWMAYGDRGADPKIPPNAILIFDIELLSFK